MQQVALGAAATWLRQMQASHLHARPMVRHAAAGVGAASGLLHSPNRKVNVSHILVSLDRAADLDACEAELAAQGPNAFPALAAKHSECTFTTKRGGAIGWLERGSYFPSVEQAAYATPVNGTARVTSPRGHHLLLVTAEKEEVGIQQMSPQELAELLADPQLLEDVQLVDVREPWEMEASSLPGFRPLRGPDGGIDSALDPEKQTVVLCHHGVRSMYASHALIQAGFQRVHNVAGGIDAYSRQVDPRVPLY